MNDLLDFAGSILYLAFMVFLVPILMFLYALAGIWRFTIFLNLCFRQLLSLFISLHPARIPMAARPGSGMHRRRLAGVHA